MQQQEGGTKVSEPQECGVSGSDSRAPWVLAPGWVIESCLRTRGVCWRRRATGGGGQLAAGRCLRALPGAAGTAPGIVGPVLLRPGGGLDFLGEGRPDSAMETSTMSVQ